VKFNILFGTRKIDLFNTNYNELKSIKSHLKNSDNQLITYTLNDLFLTRKFIECWKEYRIIHMKKYNNTINSYSYNYYIPRTAESIRLAKREMNSTIINLRNKGFIVDDSLELKEDTIDPELDKLNSLHYEFESTRLQLQENFLDNLKTIELWEKINHIVHFLEGGLSGKNKEYLLVIRPNLRTERYELKDEDYKHFTKTSSGDLICDYATVGKDLFACSVSNDIKLIQNKEVKPQRYLTDFVSMIFRNIDPQDDYISRHYDWCSNNGVDKFIDYKLPIHTPGRHILGRIDQSIYTSDDFYKQILSRTPEVLGTFITDDNGEIILEEYL
jgi:hypothetical protein